MEPVITFHGIEPTDTARALIDRRVETLFRLAPRMTGCRVTVDVPQKRKVHGRIVRVQVRLDLPGPDIVAGARSSQGSARDDLALAVNRAFVAAERQFARQSRKMGRVEVKQHPEIHHGEVAEIEPDLGYGWVRSDDGRDVYFQRDAFDNGDWRKLSLRTRLRFRIESGVKGPFATGISVA